MTRLRAPTVAAVALLCSLAACSSGTRRGPPASADAGVKPTTLLVMGGSATEGDGLADRLRDAWPYLLYHESFPRKTNLVNAALDGATVANAHTQQLPLAQEVKPDGVAIWLGADDLLQRTPINIFASSLKALIEDLRTADARRVLVADLPKVLGGGVSSYNSAIRRVVVNTKTTLIELSESALTLAPTGGLPDQPDAVSHRLVANTFEHALQAKP